MSILSDWLQLTNFADIGGGGPYNDVSWHSPSYARVQDGNTAWAWCYSNGDNTNWLRATGVVNPLEAGKVPVGAVVHGAEVGLRIQCHQATNGVGNSAPVRIQLVRNGSRVGNIHTVDIGNCYGTATCWHFVTIGGATDMFGLTITRDGDINSSGFGVAIQGTEPSGDGNLYEIDRIAMRFYYEQVGMLAVL